MKKAAYGKVGAPYADALAEPASYPLVGPYPIAVPPRSPVRMRTHSARS
jgi:hypothetical protein